MKTGWRVDKLRSDRSACPTIPEEYAAAYATARSCLIALAKIVAVLRSRHLR